MAKFQVDGFMAHDHKTFANSRSDWLFVSEPSSGVLARDRSIAAFRSDDRFFFFKDGCNLKFLAKAESTSLGGKQRQSYKVCIYGLTLCALAHVRGSVVVLRSPRRHA